jgi:hypothetical protein
MPGLVPASTNFRRKRRGWPGVVDAKNIKDLRSPTSLNRTEADQRVSSDVYPRPNEPPPKIATPRAWKGGAETKVASVKTTPHPNTIGLPLVQQPTGSAGAVKAARRAATRALPMKLPLGTSATGASTK